MFDFLLKAQLNGGPLKGSVPSFMENNFYKEVSAREYTKTFGNVGVTYLERSETEANYAKASGNHYFVYGSVFTNNEYFITTGHKPAKIEAADIMDLMRQYGKRTVDYIKGSFVLIKVNEKTGEVQLLSDRMNVLPLYYCYKENTLVVSSSVPMIIRTHLPSKEVNNQALVEQLVFDYVLGAKTYFKDIQALPPATIMTFNANGKESEEYWDVTRLYHEELLPRDQSLEMLTDQLHQNVELYTSDTDKILVAFTGGYDGRTNVAMLDRPTPDYLCFSFGMARSKQITIPKYICEKMGINYTPIPLGEDFERQYEALASEVIEFSNGTAPIIRANYPYAFRKLKHFSNTVLTGLFGSEILRPIHNLGIMMNDNSERILLSDNPQAAFEQTMTLMKQKKYLRPELIDQVMDTLWQDIDRRFIKKYESYGNLTGMFFFLLEEGVRKYFMQELQHERPYITNRFPYFDADLVDLIYKTPYAGMYNGFLGKSKVKRRNAQLLYAHILKKYKPQLGKYEVDRGYAPNDMLRMTPFNYMYLLLGVVKTKLYNKKHGDDAFKSEEWAKETIKNTLAGKIDKRGIFDSGLQTGYDNGSFAGDLLTYTHMISLVRYLDGLQ